MRRILQLLKNVRSVNALRRFNYASKNYFFDKYLQMIRWVINSKEDTNYTYHLTEENLNYLAQTIAFITKSNFSSIIGYFSEAQQNKEIAFLKEKIQLKQMQAEAYAAQSDLK